MSSRSGRTRTSSSRASAQASARARLAAEQQRQARQRRRLMIVAIPLAVVLVAVLGFVVVRFVLPSTPAATSGVADQSVITTVTSVPTSTLDRIGAGTASGTVRRIDAPALTVGGKPQVLYVGAEYCPYCAAERWAVVVALSRFGTFSGLGQTTSSARDVFPSTATLSFHGASFSGDAVAFSGYELQDNGASGQVRDLDTLPTADQQVLDTYNRPPYVTNAGSIPFVDIGGRYVISGATLSPQVLAGKTQAEIAAALADPQSDIARAVGGAANVITAAVCAATNQQPAAVCTSAGVTAGAAKLS